MSKKAKITEEFVGYKGIISSLLAKLGYVSAPDIEDILQETFIRTYQSAIEREIKFPKAYMVKTALRLAKRGSEQRAKSPTISPKDFAELPNSVWPEVATSVADEPEHSSMQMQEFGQMCDAVNTLPTQCRKVFILKKIFGYSQKEIAASLGLSESTVEKHVAKGMLACTRYLKQQQATSQTSTLANEDTAKGALKGK